MYGLWEEKSTMDCWAEEGGSGFLDVWEQSGREKSTTDCWAEEVGKGFLDIWEQSGREKSTIDCWAEEVGKGFLDIWEQSGREGPVKWEKNRKQLRKEYSMAGNDDGSQKNDMCQ
jgi:hypothetical protein